VKICLVVGARPHFIKAVPLLRAVEGLFLCDTGQHYDARLRDIFFDELDLPEPRWSLGVGSGSHAVQTGRIMAAFEAKCLEDRPDAVLVIGDTNSTLAAALVASKLQIPLGHVEAGLRSYDRAMPEEINRLAVDVISDRLYAPSLWAAKNLVDEGKSTESVRWVGNVLTEAALLLREKERAPTFDVPQGFALVTLHRPGLVDDPETLAAVFKALDELAERVPLIYPVHPRTRDRLRSLGVMDTRVQVVPPVGYLTCLWLMQRARLVITDSGGVQEETTVLNTPCATVRNNTERPTTVWEGTNTLIGASPESIRRLDLGAHAKTAGIPPKWEGGAGERIASDLRTWLR